MQKDTGVSDSTESTVSDEDSTETTQTQINAKDHARAIDDLKKFKGKSKDLETKLSQLTTELEEIKSGKLKEQNDFKSLYEQATNKNKDWESRFNKMKESVHYSEKYRAAQSALASMGMKKDAYKMLDKERFDDIIVEHTSEGRMLLSGIDEFASKFKEEYPFAFEEKKSTKVNGGGGGSAKDEGDIDVLKLDQLGRKHGYNSPEFRKGLEQFQKQKKAT